MAVRPIRLMGDDVLWQRCAPVADPGAPEVAGLVTDLRDTLRAFRREHGCGRGIAAPQIGEARRVLVIEAPALGFSDGPVNPVVRSASPEAQQVWDFCFSFPDLVGQVARSRRITVEYHDPGGPSPSLNPGAE